MTSATKRIENYTSKLIPSRVKEDFETKKPAMLVRYTATTDEICTIQDRVRGILSGETVYPGWPVARYQAFAMEIYRAQKQWRGGNQLIQLAALIIAKWKFRGCAEPILAKIRDEVFAIPAPSVP
jgi:hypothetical protein